VVERFRAYQRWRIPVVLTRFLFPPMKLPRVLILVLLLLKCALGATPADDQLVAACAKGDLPQVRKLLGKSQRVNVEDGEGRTPLLSAIFSKNEQLVALLLERGADPNIQANCPESRCSSHPALVFAVHMNLPGVVKRLIAAKADLSWDDHHATRRANKLRKTEIYQILKAAGGREWKTFEGAEAEATPAGRNEGAAAAGLSELLPRGDGPIREPGEKLRFAVIADEATEAAGDLLLAELSAAGMDVVERRELQRVLEEKSLARDFAADSANAPGVAAIVGADVLLLLQKVTVQEQEFARLRVVRIFPGIMLHTAHRPWPLSDLPEWARDAAAQTAALRTKLSGKQGIALSPADFRPATNTLAAVTLARGQVCWFPTGWRASRR
jgi:hypothetical protein